MYLLKHFGQKQRAHTHTHHPVISHTHTLSAELFQNTLHSSIPSGSLRLHTVRRNAEVSKGPAFLVPRVTQHTYTCFWPWQPMLLRLGPILPKLQEQVEMCLKTESMYWWMLAYDLKMESAAGGNSGTVRPHRSTVNCSTYCPSIAHERIYREGGKRVLFAVPFFML